jgi:hypothetical protein
MDWYYMKQGYTLVPTSGVETGHWFGGEAYHQASRCPGCKNPLLLLADIDCKKIRHKEKSKLFHATDRLPLYYCWRCDGVELSYIVNDAKGIKVVKYQGEKIPSDSPWHKNYPNSFPRRPISLVPIDYSLAKLLELYQVVESEWLSKEDNRAIQKGLKHLRHSEFTSNDVNRHQLGGLLRLIQDHESIGCPNSRCVRHKLFFKDGSKGYFMKELAVLFNDPISGLPMVQSLESLKKEGRHWNEWVQVIFWICEECLTITASNRCD